MFELKGEPSEMKAANRSEHQRHITEDEKLVQIKSHVMCVCVCVRLKRLRFILEVLLRL